MAFHPQDRHEFRRPLFPAIALPHQCGQAPVTLAVTNGKVSGLPTESSGNSDTLECLREGTDGTLSIL